MTKKSLRELGEFGLIRKIQRLAGQTEHLTKGIGDDCAIQQQKSGLDLLTSTDLLLEGVHFNRHWSNMEHLGRKAAAVNISDIAAMGGTPKSLFLGLGCPPDSSPGELEKFIAGFIAEAGEYGAILAGGDTSRSSGPFVVSVTVQGEVPSGKAVRRDTAQPGDAIYVSGTLGDSALALKILQQGQQPEAVLAERHHLPKARVALGQQLSQRGLATAMLDISDGLLSDLGHILESSKVGAEIELGKLPLSEPFKAELQQNPNLIDLALTGGEDYELLFTATAQDLAKDRNLIPAVTQIGTIRAEPGLLIQSSDGTPYHCARGGFDHFT